MRTFLTIVGFSAAWAGYGIASGWLVTRVPLGWLDHDTFLTRLRPWEYRGRVYDRRLRVRRWKDRLPEAGALFTGGVAKDRIRSFAPGDLERLVVETRRAEWVHWSNVAFGTTFVWWTEPAVAVVMVVFGAVVHLPFVIVQRYNRARLDYVLSNQRQRATVRR